MIISNTRKHPHIKYIILLIISCILTINIDHVQLLARLFYKYKPKQRTLMVYQPDCIQYIFCYDIIMPVFFKAQNISTLSSLLTLQYFYNYL